MGNALISIGKQGLAPIKCLAPIEPRRQSGANQEGGANQAPNNIAVASVAVLLTVAYVHASLHSVAARRRFVAPLRGFAAGRRSAALLSGAVSRRRFAAPLSRAPQALRRLTQ